jgi:hypothetical protein
MLRRTGRGGHDRHVIRTIGRFLLLRVLPRRLLPVLTVVEVAQLLRAARRQRSRRRAEAAAGDRGPDRWSDAFAAHRARSDSDDSGMRGEGGVGSRP